MARRNALKQRRRSSFGEWRFGPQLHALQPCDLVLVSAARRGRLLSRRPVKAADAVSLAQVATPGRFYATARSVTGHSCDHLVRACVCCAALSVDAVVAVCWQAIVLPHGLALQIGPPVVRLIPVELLLTPRRRPLVCARARARPRRPN